MPQMGGGWFHPSTTSLRSLMSLSRCEEPYHLYHASVSAGHLSTFPTHPVLRKSI